MEHTIMPPILSNNYLYPALYFVDIGFCSKMLARSFSCRLYQKIANKRYYRMLSDEDHILSAQ